MNTSINAEYNSEPSTRSTVFLHGEILDALHQSKRGREVASKSLLRLLTGLSSVKKMIDESPVSRQGALTSLVIQTISDRVHPLWRATVPYYVSLYLSETPWESVVARVYGTMNSPTPLFTEDGPPPLPGKQPKSEPMHVEDVLQMRRSQQFVGEWAAPEKPVASNSYFDRRDATNDDYISLPQRAIQENVREKVASIGFFARAKAAMGKFFAPIQSLQGSVRGGLRVALGAGLICVAAGKPVASEERIDATISPIEVSASSAHTHGYFGVIPSYTRTELPDNDSKINTIVHTVKHAESYSSIFIDQVIHKTRTMLEAEGKMSSTEELKGLFSRTFSRKTSYANVQQMLEGSANNSEILQDFERHPDLLHTGTQITLDPNASYITESARRLADSYSSSSSVTRITDRVRHRSSLLAQSVASR